MKSVVEPKCITQMRAIKARAAPEMEKFRYMRPARTDFASCLCTTKGSVTSVSPSKKIYSVNRLPAMATARETA